MDRLDVRFVAGDGECAAWLYRPEAEGPLPCVVMANGFSMTRHDGLPPYAEQLAAAGAAVLVFDHRHLGDSSGEPRQRFRKSLQLEDWEAAVAHARGLDGVDPTKIILWGFSFSGAHAVETAAADPGIAAILLLCPFLDGLARVLATPPRVTAWILPKALADMAGRHVTIPVAGAPGTKAALTAPGELDGFQRAAAPGGWCNEISPGLFATVAFHRPVRLAPKIACPAFVGLGTEDITASGKAIEKFAQRAPRAELHRYKSDHFHVFLDDLPRRIGRDQVEFLRKAGVLTPEPVSA